MQIVAFRLWLPCNVLFDQLGCIRKEENPHSSINVREHLSQQARRSPVNISHSLLASHSSYFPPYHDNKYLATIQRHLELTALWHQFNVRQVPSRDKQTEQESSESNSGRGRMMSYSIVLANTSWPFWHVIDTELVFPRQTHTLTLQCNRVWSLVAFQAHVNCVEVNGRMWCFLLFKCCSCSMSNELQPRHIWSHYLTPVFPLGLLV